MNLAEKIMNLRRQKGWSQETLAEKLDVTRQSVSKWESAQSVPDLDKILALSELFGVTTDYLLKENCFESDGVSENLSGNHSEEPAEPPVRLVDLPEAKEFLELKNQSATWIAAAVGLCILCPVPLMLLMAFVQEHVLHLSEDAAGALGVIILLGMVAAAVSVFIRWGLKLQPYEYLEKEEIRITEDVVVFVRKERKAAQKQYSRNNIIGVVLCILAAVPLIAVAMLPSDMNEFLAFFGVCLILGLISLGVYLMVSVGIPRGAEQMLLQEGDYTVENKERSKWTGPIAGIYWLLVVAIYLMISLKSGSWDTSWIIWPVAGVLFGALMIFCGMIRRK
ncbi:MAG: helix-turn-helix transcriptional regulator [Firmicutes bacterium]|nr:helix-turn-helix transcriptional regulator [Bacillota bacterium]